MANEGEIKSKHHFKNTLEISKLNLMGSGVVGVVGVETSFRVYLGNAFEIIAS